MVFRRRRFVAGRRRRVKRSGLRRGRRLGIYNPMPTFTEVLPLANVSLQPTGVGTSAQALGIWSITPSQIPQIANYAALYNQIKIKKVKIMVIPQYNSYDPSGPSGAAVNPAVSIPRLTYAVNDTSSLIPPTSELDVLTDNGSKTRMLTRPISITFRPVPSLGESISTGGFAAVNQKNRYLTTNASGLSVPHYGVSYSVWRDYEVSDPLSCAAVYARVTFTLRDPK